MSNLDKALKHLMAREQAEPRKPHYDIPDSDYARIVQPHAAAMRMVREAIGELFGPVAGLESEEAVLLRGPEPHHDAEAIIAALQRVKEEQVRLVQGLDRLEDALEKTTQEATELSEQLNNLS